MSDESEAREVRQTVRFPKDIHEALVRLAAGNATHPPSSFNRTLMWVIRNGLKAIEQQEQEPGNGVLVPLEGQQPVVTA